MMPGGQGTLTGHAYVAGGPSPGARRPVRGAIIVQGGHAEHRVTVGADGEYRIALPVGTYTVTMPRSDYGKSSCSVDNHVTVARGRTVVVDVVCQIR